MPTPPTGLLPLDDAVARILEGVESTAVETVSLREAAGRVLAAPVMATGDLPAADESAMDGYAVRAGEIGSDGARLPVSQRIFAGHVGGPLAAGTVARIFTGAALPAGADAVVAQEDCEVEEEGGQMVRVPPVSLWENVRKVGESVRRGESVLLPGVRLGAAEVGLSAGVGHAEVSVHVRPRVAVFSTGDELREAGEALHEGQIHDANRPMLVALIEGLGAQCVDLGRIPDDRAQVVARLGAVDDVDAIVTSGGVSVGEADHVHEAARELGELAFWKVAIKPGKPLAFGRVGHARFFGLPGNPVSAFVTFCLFVRPYLLRRAGRSDVAPLRRAVVADFDRRASPTRRELLRARVEIDPDGGERVRLFSQQGSHVLGSLAWATGLVELAPGTSVARGDAVMFWPFAELLR